LVVGRNRIWIARPDSVSRVTPITVTSRNESLWVIFARNRRWVGESWTRIHLVGLGM
jgi:hypothetical protein